ncbi:MAG: hypothetical protein ACXVQ0_13505 [Actinomycetota bacterium]
MIPTVILVGLVFGRWWKVVVPAAVIAWPVLLITSGIDSGLAFFVNAGALAAANVVVGVFLFWLLRALVRSTATAARAWPHR